MGLNTDDNIEMENLNPKSDDGVSSSNNANAASKAKDNNDLMAIMKSTLNQVWMIIQVYKELYPKAYMAVVGVLSFLLVWLIIIHPMVARSHVLKRNHLEKDYSKLELHYNFRSANIDHYCLFGGDDKCNCEDPTESASREDVRFWVKAHSRNKKKLQSLIDRGVDELDVVFLGDDLAETMNGEYMGKPSRKDMKIAQLFNATFQNVLATSSPANSEKFTAVSLGISGDRTTNLFWRLKHGEMDLVKQLNPKVFWIMAGTNDLIEMGCSEEVSTLGILRVAEEIAFHNPLAIIVIQAILPRSYQNTGELQNARKRGVKWGKGATKSKQPPIGVIDLYGDRRDLQGTTAGGSTAGGGITAGGVKPPVVQAPPSTRTSSATVGGGRSTNAAGSAATGIGAGGSGGSGSIRTAGAGSSAGGGSSAANFVSPSGGVGTRSNTVPGGIRTPTGNTNSEAATATNKDERMNDLIALRQQTLEKYKQKPLAVGHAKPGANSTLAEKKKFAKDLYKKKDPLERPKYMREFWPSIQQINYELEHFCEKHDHFIYYDASALFIGSIGNKHYTAKTTQLIAELMPDYIHMSYTGYKLYSDAMNKELQRIILDDDETNDVVVKSKVGGRRLA